jgi:Uma2 family endonuclease
MAATVAPHVGGDQFVLEGVSWQLYEMLLHELAEQRVFVTFDAGRLELMSPSPEHEWWKSLIGRLIEALALERSTAAEALGSTTFKRRDLAKGLEPDECYYLRGAGELRRKREADLTRDPPPDLVVEIDITPRAIDRESLYAALGVPEVWRFDGRTLSVLLLQPDGSYQAAEASAAFPTLRVADVQRFLSEAQDRGQGPTVLAFRDWIRSGGAS